VIGGRTGPSRIGASPFVNLDVHRLVHTSLG
jgi:hypothetical protein